MPTPSATLLPEAAASTPAVLRKKQPWLRSLGLVVFLLFSIALYAWLKQITPTDPNSTASSMPFLQVELLCFLPYAAACALLLIMRPVEASWRKVELGLILGGALLLRALLVDLPPNLSHDAWRYVWDARIFLRGYSPYATVPSAGIFMPLRDFIYNYSRYRNVPSLYPPGAQYIYATSYLLAPSNLFFLKGMFVLFDLGSCVALVVLLARKGLDPALVLLYAWCPLPIVEFALQGHIDAAAIPLTLLAALSVSRKGWKSGVLTGFLIGMATLVKLYPILLLLPALSLRDWKRDGLLVCTCLVTVGTGYLPFIILGHGQILGFFSTYTDQQGWNAGPVQNFIAFIGSQEHWPVSQKVVWEHGVALVLFAGAAVLLLKLRASGQLTFEAGALVMFGLILAVSSHLFPWYLAALLPWIVLLLPSRGSGAVRGLALAARLLALGALWIFLFTSILGYFLDWASYYHFVYVPLVAELLMAGVLALVAARFGHRRKEQDLPPELKPRSFAASKEMQDIA